MRSRVPQATRNGNKEGILFRRKKSVAPLPSASASPYQPLTEVLSASVADALRTISLIGGYLILFAVLSAAMEQAGLFSLLSRLLFFLPLSTETLRGLCSGILEMTNGAHLLSLSPDSLRLRWMFWRKIFRSCVWANDSPYPLREIA